MHRLYICKPGSLTYDGAVIGRFVELKDAGLEGDLVTYNTLLKACMRSANLPCAHVIMTWIRERGLQVSLQPRVLVTLLALLRTKLAWLICHLSRGACSVKILNLNLHFRYLRFCAQPFV